MQVLYFLESIRTEVGNVFFSAVTHLGEETLFILLGLLFFWCINKKQGYYLLAVGLLGTICNQFLKLCFRIPRPWVRDEHFTIVESAREEAVGYSFPSGHTQASVGLFGGIARCRREKLWRMGGIVLCVLVPFSRLYLGVHTPADVGVSVLLALALVFGLHPLIFRATRQRATMRILFACLLAATVGLVCFAALYPFPQDIDLNNLESGLDTACKMLGCMLGLWVVYELDEHFIHFETDAVWWAQILKVLLGLIPLLAVKEGLRGPLNRLFAVSYVADCVRYFLLVLAVGSLWPLTFRLFAKLGKKKENA